MIDFRYHLVSLVSVFMALAIGVVLGAGPLQDTIGATLSNQVDALRADKENLQVAVANREELLADRNAFVDAVAGELVADQLADTPVVLVPLPGTTGPALEALRRQVEAAGGTVTGQVSLQPGWVASSRQRFREDVLADLEDRLGGAAADPSLPALLAAAVVAGGAGPAPGAADAEAVLTGLRDADLVTVDGDVSGERAALAVVVVPSARDTVPEAEDRDAVTDTYLRTALALDRAGEGVVVAGAAAAAEEGGLVLAVRSDPRAAERVSTVDGLDVPPGQVTTVLALREQADGGAGHYGFGEGAGSPVPPRPVGEVRP